MDKPPYKLCRLVDYGGDVSKRWFLIFYIWSEHQQKMIRRRYTAINFSNRTSVRYLAATNAKIQIDRQLKQGVTYEDRPAAVKMDNKLAEQPLLKALHQAYEWRKPTLKKVSTGHFRTFVANFADFLKETGNEKIKVKQLNTMLVGTYRNWVLALGVSNRTANNYVNAFATLVSEMKYRDANCLKTNPFERLTKLKAQVRRHTAFSIEQMKELLAIMDRLGEQQLKLYVYFLYYTLIRPNELDNLKVEYIDLENNRIWVPEKISKNKQSDYVDIYPPLRDQIEHYGIMAADPAFYIFSIDNKPGPKPVYSNYFYKHNVRVLKEANLHMGNRTYDLYSYKHSGACNLYLSGVDMVSIQRQLRHLTTSETMKYLRDLDLFRDQSHIDKVRAI